ncbi:MAG: ABC transporter substrate-binding protein [Oscillospiraceae bacterium]|nr:ABC transporter substrate-binding protein [Oscillospiraceae bacterium]
MMRRLLLLALAAALCAGMTGCGETESAPESTPESTATAAPLVQTASVPFVLPYVPSADFSPLTGENTINLALGGLIYEGLFTISPTFDAELTLCREYSVSEDGLTWHFLLKSTTFSDGTSLTAADVVSSLNTARQSTRYKARLSGVKDVTASADGGVDVTLASQNGGLPQLLDVPIVRESGDPTLPLGTGAYVMRTEGEERRLVRREGREEGLAEIPLYAVEGDSMLLSAVEGGEVSLVQTDPAATGALRFSGKLDSCDFSTSVMVYVGFQTQKGLCKDTELRVALQRGCDRDSIASALLSRHAQSAALPASPASDLYDSTLAQSLAYAPGDVGEALDALGWVMGDDGVRVKGKQKLTLTLLVSSENSTRVSVAERLASDFQSMGVGVTVQEAEWDEFLTLVKKGSFDLYLAETQMTADFDPGALVLSGGALNYGGYADAEVKELTAALRAAQGEARPAAAQALYAGLAENPPMVVLCFRNWSLLTKRGQITRLTPSQGNYFYHFSDWIIQTEKEIVEDG